MLISGITQLSVSKILGLFDVSLTIWAIIILFYKTDPTIYLWIIGILYFISFFIHLKAKRNMAIIVSGVIVCLAQYLIIYK